MGNADSREKLAAAIDRITKTFATEGKVIDVAAVAHAAADRHPDCGLSTEEIERLIEDSAVKNKAVLLAGRRPPR